MNSRRKDRFIWKEKDLDFDNKNPRRGRFVWKEEDLDFEEKPNKDLNNKIQSYLTTSKVPAPLGHYTNPIQESEDPKEGMIHNDDHMGMATHSNSFSKPHIDSIKDYKTSESEDPDYINTPLRKKITPEEHLSEMEDDPDMAEAIKPVAHTMRNNIKNLDYVTSYKLKKPVTLYRGVDEHFNLNRSSKPGKTFTDHGFVSTTYDPNIASTFTKNPQKVNLTKYHKPRIFRVHVPAGTKGYNVDRHISPNHKNFEKEFLLHRGTKFKVRSHSQSPHFHIVDLDVVGQHPRKI